MKQLCKWSVMALFVMSFAMMAACGSDDDDGKTEQKVTITPTSITIYHDDTWQLSAANANSWNSDDNFVAEVDGKGLVTGGHVGTTIITAKNGNSYASCEVTVAPKHNLYDTPILDWGATMASIQSKETHTKSSSSNSTMLAYNYGKNNNSCALIYFFEGGKMSRIVIYLDLFQYTTAALYLQERYTPLSAEKTDFFLMFADAYTKDKIKTIVGIQTTKVSGTELTMISYIPAN